LGISVNRGGKFATVLVTILVLVMAAAWYGVRLKRRQPVLLRGAVIVEDDDPRKQRPVADVDITASNSLGAAHAKSDSSGFFSVTLSRGIRRRQPITLQFRHADYFPLDVKEYVSDKLYVTRMVPVRREIRPEPNQPQVVVTNVLARYSVKSGTTVNVGFAVKTFQVVNTGNIPCKGQERCSPDGKWKATINSLSLDAGDANEFRNVRASCIAGPCPFTRLENDTFLRGGRSITVSARNWSDTTTFLVEAEVFHPMVGDIIRRSHPVIFGQALNFTLPATAEGVSLEADLNGSTIVFPLGPHLILSWADCNARVTRDQAKVYRCELKPGYRFP
jgi:hypothetical protein